MDPAGSALNDSIRQSEAKCCPVLARGFQFKRRADLPGEEVADGQAKSTSAWPTAVTRLEQMGADRFGNAPAFVAHFEDN